VPVLMAHNVEDSLISSRHTLAYLDTVRAAGTSRWLTRVYSKLPGHGNFTHEQMLALFDAMDYWLDTGRRPHPGHFPGRLDLTQRIRPGLAQRIWPGMWDGGVDDLQVGNE